MDAFESLIAMLLRREGYWIWPSFKVDLTKTEKRKIGLSTTPRWEIDLLAYCGKSNEILVVECKSFLDSAGVIFRRNAFEPESRYKLFTDSKIRRAVFKRMSMQLVANESCRPRPKVTLCLAAGRIAQRGDPAGLARHFAKQDWRLFDNDWINSKLKEAATSKYENDVAHVVAKLIHRREHKHSNRSVRDAQRT